MPAWTAVPLPLICFEQSRPWLEGYLLTWDCTFAHFRCYMSLDTIEHAMSQDHCEANSYVLYTEYTTCHLHASDARDMCSANWHKTQIFGTSIMWVSVVSERMILLSCCCHLITCGCLEWGSSIAPRFPHNITLSQLVWWLFCACTVPHTN